MNEQILLLENNIFEYDIFKPLKIDWWKENHQIELEIEYSVQLFKGNIKQVTKYQPDGNNIVKDSF